MYSKNPFFLKCLSYNKNGMSISNFSNENKSLKPLQLTVMVNVECKIYKKDFVD